MASCGYHSPQFSEDAAWLPPWLQPHQLPCIGGDRNGDGNNRSCQNLESLRENVYNGQDGQLFTNNDAKYSGCHLYLSGEDNSGNPSLSASQALHFHLHLSSADASQIYPSNRIPESGYSRTENSQSREFETNIFQSGKFDKVVCSFKKPVHEMPYVQDGVVYPYLTKVGTPASALPVSCDSKMSCKRIIESQKIAEQTKRRKLHGKRNHEKLNDATELSIAASEATVISEILSSGLQSEQLPAATILEIALRVKQARNEASDDPEVVPSLLADELDETDELSDLDETMMADAFDDVGIHCPQTGGTAGSSNSDSKPPQSNSSCDKATRISDSHHGIEDPEKRIQADCADAKETTSKKYDVFVINSTSNNVLLEPLPVQHTSSCACVPLDCCNSCLRSPSKPDAEKLHDKVDALTKIQMVSMDHQMHKDGKVVPLEIANIRRSSKSFKWETSFISESMDVMNESTSEDGPEAEPETVASSSTPYGGTTRCLNMETERSIHRGHGFSQDLLISPSMSLVDPLCSIVPCSISSDNSPILCDYNQKEFEKKDEKFVNSAGSNVFLELNEKANLNKAQEISLKPVVQGGDSGFSADGSIDPGVPSRKKFSSLKPYSMVMPDICTNGKIAFGQSPSHRTVLHSMQFPPPEINSNTNCFVSNKGGADVPSKPMSICVPGGLDNDSHWANNHEGANRPAIVVENDDIGAPISLYEERNLRTMLNNKKHRIRACKVISIEEILKRSLATTKRKCRTRNSMNAVRGRDQSHVKSCNPLPPSLHLHPEDNQTLQKKSVRFAESKTRIDIPESRENQQTKYQAHGSFHATNRKQKQSYSRYKRLVTKENYNYLTCSQTIDEKGMILQGLEFLLTGFSSQKGKELETLIRLYGGYVLPNIPSGYPDSEGNQRKHFSRRKLPIVLSPKKVQTTKYLYGCATNTWRLDAHWLIDSIEDGSILPPGKYMTQPIQGDERNKLRIGEPLYLNSHTSIFNNVGIMIHGRVSFCTKFSKIVKHGGGQVFKSLQRLVQSLKNGTNTQGTVIVEDEGKVSRHLKYCALENNLQTMPASWIVNSLFTGKLLPFKKDRSAAFHRIKMPTFPQVPDTDMSEEI